MSTAEPDRDDEFWSRRLDAVAKIAHAEGVAVVIPHQDQRLIVYAQHDLEGHGWLSGVVGNLVRDAIQQGTCQRRDVPELRLADRRPASAVAVAPIPWVDQGHKRVVGALVAFRGSEPFESADMAAIVNAAELAGVDLAVSSGLRRPSSGQRQAIPHREMATLTPPATGQDGGTPAAQAAAYRGAAIRVELDSLTTQRAELTAELATFEGAEPGERGPSAEPLAAKVLLVDDDQAVLLAATGPLRAAGYEVTTASNGAQALARLAQAPPDLIVADAALLDITGFELVAAIRRNPAWEHVPLIFLTTPATVGDLALGLGLGTHHYVVSPPDPLELGSRVAAALARRRPPAAFAHTEPPISPVSREAFDRA